MKNLLKLGTPLTKEAQKTVLGGYPKQIIDPCAPCWIYNGTGFDDCRPDFCS